MWGPCRPPAGLLRILSDRSRKESQQGPELLSEVVAEKGWAADWLAVHSN